MTASRTFIALLVTVTALAGCTARPAACTSSGSTAFAGQELKVLDQGAWDNAYAFAKPAFEAATGATLTQIKGADAGSALKQVIESKGNPVADVLFGVDNTLIGQAARADVFEPYESQRLSAINASLVRMADFRVGGRLLATPIDHGYVSINYDATLLEGDGPLPTRLADLANPEWAPKVVVSDPRQSSPGLNFLVTTVATFGEDSGYDYKDFWRNFLENGGLVVPDWTTAYEVHFTAGYGRHEPGFNGERTFVLSYTTSPAIEAYYGETDDAPSRSLEPAKGVFHQVEAAAIVRCTRQLPLAQAFIDFLLGKDFQDHASETMAVYPVIDGAAVIGTFENLATDPADLVPAHFTSAQIDAGVPRWLDAWTDVYQRSQA